jgi:hypothetical protein
MSRAVLVAALAAALLFISVDLVALRQWKGYDYVHQSMTQLAAIGAPTRSWTLALSIGHDVALFAVGLALLFLSGRNVALRITAGLVMISAIAWVVGELFPGRVGETPEHLSPAVFLGATAVVASVLAIVFGAAALTGWFRVVSIGLLAAFALLTVLGFMQPSPRIGLQERVMAYSIIAWTVLLGVAVMTAPASPP